MKLLLTLPEALMPGVRSNLVSESCEWLEMRVFVTVYAFSKNCSKRRSDTQVVITYRHSEQSKRIRWGGASMREKD